MSVINQNNTVIKSHSMMQRVLQRRKSNNSIVFSDPDLTITPSFTGAPVAGSVTLTITGGAQNITSVWQIGANANIFKINNLASSLVKDMTSGYDNNGTLVAGDKYTASFYLDDVNLITAITLTSSSSAIVSTNANTLYKQFPNLKKITLTNDRTANIASYTSQTALEALTFTIWTSTGSASAIRSSLATNSTLKWLALNGYNIYLTSIFDVLPASIKYFEILNCPNVVMDLTNYFTGTRMGFSSGVNGSLSYSGGAKFPNTISEDSGQAIPYIIRQQAGVTRKLTGDEAAQLLIDFANDVDYVTTAQKRIILIGSTPTAGYTDPSRPISTYTAAKTKITAIGSGGLGITLTF